MQVVYRSDFKQPGGHTLGFKLDLVQTLFFGGSDSLNYNWNGNETCNVVDLNQMLNCSWPSFEAMDLPSIQLES